MILGTLLAVACLAQQQPNPQAGAEAQKLAMKKLSFLAGKWSGEATIRRGPGEPLKIRQSEAIEYRLDGLLLLIEGTGRDDSGAVVFNAFAVVNYDEEKKEFRIRAFNAGHQTETALEVSEDGFRWGYQSGPANVMNTMRLNEKKEWVETTTVKVGERPEFTSVRMLLKHD